MSGGHTPGPWAVDDRRNLAGCLQIQAKHRGEGSSYCVATVNFWEVPDANARLIASAPDLLAALSAANVAIDDLQSALHDALHLVDYARCADGNMPLHGASKLARANELLRSDAANPIRAAIAKATGK